MELNVSITRTKLFFKRQKHGYLFLFITAIILFCSACAYRHGAPERSIPGGAQEIRIPMFKNVTQEVGIETSFTNALIDELAQSKIAKLNPNADIEVLGTIESVQYFPQGNVTGLKKIGSDQVVLATDYRIVIVMELLVKNRAEDKILWVDKFTGERTFSGCTSPQAIKAYFRWENESR